jgi:hypothetical protein
MKSIRLPNPVATEIIVDFSIAHARLCSAKHSDSFTVLLSQIKIFQRF